MFRAPAVAALVVAGLPAEANAGCDCIYQGELLPQDTVNNYPTDEPGKYSNLTSIRVYGTTCAAWESIPGTPWFSGCDLTRLTHVDHRHCGGPWCYVDSTCDSKISTKLFDGVDMYYSYGVCGAINCYGDESEDACPYDPNGEGTNRVDKTGDCACKHYGETLPSSIYTNYPTDDAGKYKDYDHIELYGTSCAAWDQVPGLPWADYCPAGSDWCHKDFNWCQAPWCYVGTGCDDGVDSDVFKGSTTSKYSYYTCADTPNCYSDPMETPGCPFNPNRWQWYTPVTCNDWSADDEDGSPSCWGVTTVMSLLTLIALTR